MQKINFLEKGQRLVARGGGCYSAWQTESLNAMDEAQQSGFVGNAKVGDVSVRVSEPPLAHFVEGKLNSQRLQEDLLCIGFIAANRRQIDVIKRLKSQLRNNLSKGIQPDSL